MAFRLRFNEAAGADPADAPGVAKTRDPEHAVDADSFNEAAGADPADAGYQAHGIERSPLLVELQ